MLQNPLSFFLLGLFFAWVASYFYSAWHNRRKLTILARWLEPALPILGSGTTSRWRGTDRLDVLIGEGRGPLVEAAIVIGVQSRRLFSAILSLLRGGRDSMSFLIRLNRPLNPASYFEIFGSKEPPPQGVLLEPEAWKIEEYSRGKPYRIAFREAAGRESALRVVALLQDLQLEIRRVSVRSSAPQLFFVFNVGQLPQSDPSELLRLLRNLAEEVTTPGRNPETNRERPSTRSKNRERDRDKNKKADGLPPRLLRPGIDPDMSRNGHHSPNGKLPKD
jgi:hypothetical protein